MTTPDRPILLRLTAAKAVVSTAVRWIPPFLPTLERAFGVSTSQLTTVLGFSEMAGFSTVAVGRHLDKGRERVIMVSALTAVSVASLIALAGSLVSFAIASVILIAGAANFTVASHTWISHRVDYRWRARSIGIFETAWAFALLIGGPLTALLISLFGWRGPFAFVSIAAAVTAVIITATVPTTAEPVATNDTNKSDPSSQRITAKAWLVVAASAMLSTCGLSLFVISGSWLDEAFGVSTAGLGAIVMGLGVFELIASAGSAAFADRLGKMQTTLMSLVVLAVGLLIMVNATGRLAVGVIGFLVFLLGFEYGIVTSFSLVSEAMPAARGRLLAIAQATGTVSRGSGVIFSGWLFEKYGINGSAALSAIAGLLSFSCLLLSHRR